MTESDYVGAVLAKASIKSKSFGVVGEWNKPSLAVAIVAHEDCEFAAGGQDAGAVGDERAVAFKECSQRGRARQVPRIRRVKFLPPIWRMRPNEVECRACGQAAKAVGIGGVKALTDVPRQARNAKFTAYVRACAAASHRVEDVLRAEEKEQIADEFAAAIAGVTTVAVFTGSAEMIEAGQMRHGAGGARCDGEPGINRLVLATG